MYSCFEIVMGYSWGNHTHPKMDAMNKAGCVFVQRGKAWGASAWTSIRSVGQEDPRRMFHAFKVGFSLTLVSLLCLMEPFFKDIGQSAIWAVMTVVVVLEFTAGDLLV